MLAAAAKSHGIATVDGFSCSLAAAEEESHSATAVYVFSCSPNTLSLCVFFGVTIL